MLWEQFSNTLLSAPLLARENETLVQFLSRPIGTGPLLTDEEWEYVGRTTNHLWIEQTPLLHWLREGEILDYTGKYELVGGMSTLIDAFIVRLKPHLKSRFRSGCRVNRVVMRDPNIDVHWSSEDHGPEQAAFDFVITTVPAPATIRIQFEPDLPPNKREALTNTSYVSAGKTLVHCSERHWELQDGIFGGNSVTDLPHQQSWYPSDNAVPKFGPDEEPGDEYGSPLRAGAFDDREPPFNFDAYWKAVDPAISNRPGVFLAAYLWGANAERFAALSDPERTELIIPSVRAVHPDNDKYMDQDPVHWSWDEQWNPGGGAFAFFKVGEQRRYQRGLSEPLVDSRGTPRVFFAGEHVAIAHGWIQSAFQSALAATISLIQAP